MKKETYQKPNIKMMKVEAERMLAASSYYDE